MINANGMFTFGPSTDCLIELVWVLYRSRQDGYAALMHDDENMMILTGNLDASL
jgi:hypothetical protein